MTKETDTIMAENSRHFMIGPFHDEVSFTVQGKMDQPFEYFNEIAEEIDLSESDEYDDDAELEVRKTMMAMAIARKVFQRQDMKVSERIPPESANAIASALEKHARMQTR